MRRVLPLALASIVVVAPASSQEQAGSLQLQGPIITIEPGSPSEIVRVERVDGPNGPRYKIWPPEMAPEVAKSLAIGMEQVILEPPPDPTGATGLPPATAARAADSEDTPETVLWNDYCRALDERRIGRGEEIGGIAAIGMRLGGKGQSGELGEIDPAVRAGVDAWNERGALVLSVVPGAPAELAGLQAGDIIVQAGPFWIDTPATLIRLASRSEVGREIELLYARAGQVERTWVTPIDRREMEALQKQ